MYEKQSYDNFFKIKIKIPSWGKQTDVVVAGLGYKQKICKERNSKKRRRPGLKGLYWEKKINFCENGTRLDSRASIKMMD